MIDIGVNLSNSRFSLKTLPETLRSRPARRGVEKLVLTGTSIAEESRAVLELCQSHNEGVSRDALRKQRAFIPTTQGSLG